MHILITNEYNKESESLVYCVYISGMFIFKFVALYQAEELATNLKDALDEMGYSASISKSYERK